MSSTLLLTEATIDDTDLYRNKYSNSSEDLLSEQSLSEDNSSDEEIIFTIDDNTSEELEIMKSIGLPIGFTSRSTTKRLNKRKKKKKKNKTKSETKTSSQTDDYEDINKLFKDYWMTSEDEIFDDSWTQFCISYKFNDSEEVETELWQKHWFEVYNKAYNKFVEDFRRKSIEKQNLIEDKFEILPKMLTNCNLNEECVDGNASNENSSSGGQTPADDNKSESKIFRTSSQSAANSPGCSSINSFLVNNHNDSDSDGPPEERPTQLKRQHESDSIDLSEENRDQIETEDTSEEKQVLKSRKKKKSKYWHQRYRLFSRFDEGIRLDKESWYSVTPERIAEHIAKRFSQKNYFIIIDAFCGSGGNTIQFALISPFIKVIAIDIDERKIGFAKHNAKIYGVDNRIEFIVADYMLFAASCGPVCKADAVFLSPPWGGPNYLKEKIYTLNMMTPNGADVFRVTNTYISGNIGFLLPRNIDTNELDQLAGQGNFVEVEKNFLNKKVKTVTAYFGNLIQSIESKH